MLEPDPHAPPPRGAALVECAAARVAGIAVWRAMGTTVHLLTDNPLRLDVALAAVHEVIVEAETARESLVPTAASVPGRAWPVRSGCPPPPMLGRLVRAALEAATLTVDPVGSRLGPRVPREEVSSSHPTADRPQLDPHLELGAALMAFTADLAADAAFAAAHCATLVDVGGDLRVQGAATRPWPVLVPDRGDLDLVGRDGQVVDLSSGGLAASSAPARLVLPRSSRRHVVNTSPRPPWRTVSVMASTCLLAKTFAAAAVGKADEAPHWLSSRHVPAQLVAEDGFVTVVGTWPGAVV